MRDLGLVPCQPKPWRRSLTEQDGQAGPIPDLVNRDFTADILGSAAECPPSDQKIRVYLREHEKAQ